MKTGRNILKIAFLFSYILILILSGFDFQRIFLTWLGMTISFFWLTLVKVIKKKLVYPKAFKLYLIFLICFFVSLSWSRSFFTTFSFLLLYAAGGAFWLVLQNLDLSIDEKRRGVFIVLFSLGIVFATKFITGYLSGSIPVSSFSLVGYSSVNKNHHHIGDLMAPVIVSIACIMSEKRGCWKNVFILSMTLIILILSTSRSALLATGCGLFHLLLKNSTDKQRVNFFKIALPLLVVTFIFVSQKKDLFLSRQYFVQSVAGLIRYHLGVGVGNFAIISRDPAVHFWNMADYSLVAHNIFLELLSGMGWFGLTFVILFFVVLRDTLTDRKKQNALTNALLLTLSVNFLFDFTYVIPTMLWMWFGLLGVKDD